MNLPFATEREDDGDGVVTIRFTGELDMASAPAAEEQLRRAEAQGRPILLDLRGLRFLDTAGLRAIMAADRLIRQAGGRLVLRRGSRPVRRVFELTKAEEQLEIADYPPAA